MFLYDVKNNTANIPAAHLERLLTDMCSILLQVDTQADAISEESVREMNT